MPRHGRTPNRSRSFRSIVAGRFADLLCNSGTVSVVVAGVVGLAAVNFHVGAADPEDRPGAGIIVRTEAIAVQIPEALRELAQSDGAARALDSPDSLRAELERRRLNEGRYAVTYRGYQVNGGSADVTQTRRVGDAPAHLEEFRDIIATAVGRPPLREGCDFSHATVNLVPDTAMSWRSQAE